MRDNNAQLSPIPNGGAFGVLKGQKSPPSPGAMLYVLSVPR